MMGMSRGAAAAIALTCCALLLFGINRIAERTLPGDRIDLTQKQIYTLSAGTQATLARLDEPITVRFYYSRRLDQDVPSYAAYARHVQDMLEEYAARAHGRIRLRIIDPLPYSPEEDLAVAAGVQPVPIDAEGDQVYFGIAATNATDDQQVIPFLYPTRERLLEYDLTRLLHALAVPRRTQLALMSDLPLQGDMVAAAMQGQPMQPYALLEQLQQLYDVRTLPNDTAQVPDDVDVLMLVHPKALPDGTQFAIDQYVLKGGKALVFLDPLSEFELHNPSPINAPDGPHASSLDRLLAAWGATMDPGLVVVDRLAARRVNAGDASRVRAVDYLGWLGLHEPNFNADDPITADLKLVNMATAGAIEPVRGAHTHFEPLISTSLAAMKMPVARFTGRPDFAGLLASFKPADESFALAARLTGPAGTAFPDGPPADPKAPAAQSAAAKAALTIAKQPIDVVVVGDTDMLADRFWVKLSTAFGHKVADATSNNADFVTNAIDVLAGGPDLAALRSRASVSRPFSRVQTLQLAAEDRYSAEEHELQLKLTDTRARLRDLGVGDPVGQTRPGIVLTAAQVTALDGFRADMQQTRRQLRAVQLVLRQGIDRLRDRLEFLDIAAVPLLVALAGMAVGAIRLRRHRRRAVAG